MSVSDITIILNPIAGGGKCETIRHDLENELRRRGIVDYSFLITTRKGEASIFARESAESGSRLIIAAGGDGTINEVVNGLFLERDPFNEDCELGIINCGTGAGLAQTLHLPSSLPEQIDHALISSAYPIDVGCVTYLDFQGQTCQRLYVSECQVGLGGSVVKDVGINHKHWGGKIAFGTVALRHLFNFKAIGLTVILDDQEEISGDFLGVVIGNGSHCGGGMQLTPRALPDDGFLDVLLIPEMTINGRLRSFSKIYSGTHIHSTHFDYRRIRKICIRTEGNVLVETDGELIGTTPCEISIIPACLMVRGNKELK